MTTAPHDPLTPAAVIARRIAVLVVRLQAVAALFGIGFGVWLAAASNNPANRQKDQLANLGVALGFGIAGCALVVAVLLLGCARSLANHQKGAAQPFVIAEAFVGVGCLQARAPLAAVGIASAVVAIVAAVIVSQSEHNRSQLPPPPAS